MRLASAARQALLQFIGQSRRLGFRHLRGDADETQTPHDGTALRPGIRRIMRPFLDVRATAARPGASKPKPWPSSSPTSTWNSAAPSARIAPGTWPSTNSASNGLFSVRTPMPTTSPMNCRLSCPCPCPTATCSRPCPPISSASSKTGADHQRRPQGRGNHGASAAWRRARMRSIMPARISSRGVAAGSMRRIHNWAARACSPTGPGWRWYFAARFSRVAR